MVRSEKRHAKREKVKQPLFDIGVVFQYLILSGVFAMIVFAVNSVVMMAVRTSPTNQAGNQFLTLYEVHNTGAAFNLFSGQTSLIINSSFLALAVIFGVVIAYSARLNQTATSALSFVTAGIAMNLYERIEYGYVIDYISCNFAPYLPVFNTADMMIVVGAIGLVFSLLTRK